MDVKCIADRIVKAVDDSFKLGAQAIEIHRRGDDEHFGLGHFFIDDLHIVFLAAIMVFAAETRSATHAGIDFVIVNRNHFDMVLWRSPLDESIHQQIGIAALARAP